MGEPAYKRQPFFQQLPGWIDEALGEGRQAASMRRVLQAIAAKADRPDAAGNLLNAWGGRELARFAGVKPRQLRRVLVQLDRIGYLVLIKQGGRVGGRQLGNVWAIPGSRGSLDRLRAARRRRVVNVQVPGQTDRLGRPKFAPRFLDAGDQIDLFPHPTPPTHPTTPSQESGDGPGHENRIGGDPASPAEGLRQAAAAPDSAGAFDGGGERGRCASEDRRRGQGEAGSVRGQSPSGQGGQGPTATQEVEVNDEARFTDDRNGAGRSELHSTRGVDEVCVDPRSSRPLVQRVQVPEAAAVDRGRHRRLVRSDDGDVHTRPLAIDRGGSRSAEALEGREWLGTPPTGGECNKPCNFITPIIHLTDPDSPISRGPRSSQTVNPVPAFGLQPSDAISAGDPVKPAPTSGSEPSEAIRAFGAFGGGVVHDRHPPDSGPPENTPVEGGVGVVDNLSVRGGAGGHEDRLRAVMRTASGGHEDRHHAVIMTALHIPSLPLNNTSSPIPTSPAPGPDAPGGDPAGDGGPRHADRPDTGQGPDGVPEPAGGRGSPPTGGVVVGWEEAERVMRRTGVSPSAIVRLRAEGEVRPQDLVELCERVKARGGVGNPGGWVIEAARRVATRSRESRRRAASERARERDQRAERELADLQRAVEDARRRLSLADPSALRCAMERLKTGSADPVARLLALVDPTCPRDLTDRMAIRLASALGDGGGAPHPVQRKDPR